MMEITTPGLYPGMDEATYHGDPVPSRLGGSLSNSGAKLLAFSTPAHFKWARDNGRPPKRAFDLGHAVHKYVLREGDELVIVEKTAKDGTRLDADDYTTKSAQEHREAIRAEGKIPLLRKEDDQAQSMAASVLRHPVARILFDPDHGTPEVSGFWQDPETEVWQRLRVDWLPDARGRRLIVPDLKTSNDADPTKFGKKAADFGYFMQHPFYLGGLQHLGLADDDAAFIFVNVETAPPHLVSVVELDEDAVALGRQLIRQALRTYAECMGTDTWPGYSQHVELASLPYYFTRQLEGAFA